MFIIEQFGERLRSLRKEHGLSQQELAERLGVSHMTVRRLESDESRPQGEILAGLVNALGVDLEWLLTGRSSTYSVLMRECVPIFETVDALQEGKDGQKEWIKLPGLPKSAKAIVVTSDDMLPTIQVGDIAVVTDEIPGQNDAVLIRDARGKARVRFYDSRDGGSLLAENQNYPPIKVDDNIKIIGKVIKTIRTIDL